MASDTTETAEPKSHGKGRYVPMPYRIGCERVLTVLLRTSQALGFTPEQFVAFAEKVHEILGDWRKSRNRPDPFIDTAIAEALKAGAEPKS